MPSSQRPRPPPLTPPISQEELTASALEALALGTSFRPTTITHAPFSSDPRSASAQQSLTRVMKALNHSAAHKNLDMMHRSIRAVQAVALASSAHLQSVVALGVVPALTVALGAWTERRDARSAQLTAATMAVVMRDSLARCHFEEAASAGHLIAALRQFSLDPDVVTAVCTAIAAHLPALSTATAVVWTYPDALVDLRNALVISHDSENPALAVAVLDVASALVRSADEVDTPDAVSMSSIQKELRRADFFDIALRVMESMFAQKSVRHAGLSFFLAVLKGCTQNLVEFGKIRESAGLQLVVRCLAFRSPDENLKPTKDDAHAVKSETDRIETQCISVELLLEVAQLQWNFDILLEMGLVSRLVALLSQLTNSPKHANICLDLLHRSVRNSKQEARNAYAEFAALPIVNCMQTQRHNATIQESSIRLLTSLLEKYGQNREVISEVQAIQAVYYAMTEHASNPTIIEASCQFLLQVSPMDIFNSNLSPKEIIAVGNSRMHTHRNAEQVKNSIEELIQALEIVSTFQVEQGFTRKLSRRQRNQSAADMKSLEQMSSKPSDSPTFSRSFHRRMKQNKAGSSSLESFRCRRVRSDFVVEGKTSKGRRRDMLMSRGSSQGCMRVTPEPKVIARLWSDSVSKNSADSESIHSDAEKVGDNDVGNTPLRYILDRSRQTTSEAPEYSSHELGRSGSMRGFGNSALITEKSLSPQRGHNDAFVDITSPSKNRSTKDTRAEENHGNTYEAAGGIRGDDDDTDEDIDEDDNELSADEDESDEEVGNDGKTVETTERRYRNMNREEASIEDAAEWVIGSGSGLSSKKLSRFPHASRSSNSFDTDIEELRRREGYDSALSFSESEVDSMEDKWGRKKGGYTSIYPQSVDDEDLEERVELEGDTADGQDYASSPEFPSIADVDAEQIPLRSEKEIDISSLSKPINSEQISEELLSYIHNASHGEKKEKSESCVGGENSADEGAVAVSTSGPLRPAKKYGERKRTASREGLNGVGWSRRQSGIWAPGSLENSENSRPTTPVKLRGESGSLDGARR